MACRRCYECGDLGNFTRECPRHRLSGPHSSSQGSALRAVAQTARGGAQSSRGGFSGRGGTQTGRGGGHGGSQYNNGHAQFYAFLGRLEAKASNAVITGNP
ncbi:H/ACA ribonucleoprotein complex subunit GAR1-like [Lycium barbarum]|uniref:H/ACA ribonucleoprotein complex subunit GAR1-like n=1 Tax=Lycium barbarum TaxID=112863 RepID=UPI00293EE3B8|nr:H/ACA ribonucleoprotein complex subunit GAR1-like [Lycium barbarum]